MKKKTVKAAKRTNAKVSRKNDWFKSLKPAEKRVAIARDVLAQLASGRLLARAGIWLAEVDSGWNLLDGDEAQKQKNTELQTILKKMDKCTGCALGGMFMCAVERANKLKVKELTDFAELSKEELEHGFGPDDVQVDESDTTRYLKKFFSFEQLELIESAFERGTGALGGAAADFCKTIDDPSERMRLIMENIVQHKGKFCPEQKPVQVWATPGFEG